MKQPKLKKITSPDAIDLYAYKLETVEYFMLRICLDIIFEDSNDFKTFYLTVCSPEWLKVEYELNGAQWGKHLLIVFPFNFTAIEKKIKECLVACEDQTWDEVEKKINRFAARKFENYKP